jgi:hypothetical protein
MLPFCPLEFAYADFLLIPFDFDTPDNRLADILAPGLVFLNYLQKEI